MEESQQSPIQATLLCCLDSYTASKMEGGGEELENGEKKRSETKRKVERLTSFFQRMYTHRKR
jgi:hypothetical protein